MPRRLDLTNQRYGRLVARTYAGNQRWNCSCDCGNSITVITDHLRNGNTKSCGCLRKDFPNRTTHGECGSAEYRTWIAMRDRCNNPNNAGFRKYGGRGIKVCQRWKSFENFLSDMGRKPSPEHSIDRINNNGNYTPKNCRWADAKTQANNARISEWQHNIGKRLAASGMYHNKHLKKWLPNRHHVPNGL